MVHTIFPWYNESAYFHVKSATVIVLIGRVDKEIIFSLGAKSNSHV